MDDVFLLDLLALDGGVGNAVVLPRLAVGVLDALLIVAPPASAFFFSAAI